MTLRLYAVGTVAMLAATVFYAALGLPFRLPIAQAPLGIALTLVVTAQHLWPVNGRDAFRRSIESLDGMPFTFGAFFLDPGWYVVMVVVGSFIAWTIGSDHTPRIRWFNTGGQALLAVSSLYVFGQIGPSGPLDSPEALFACLGIWFATETIRLLMVFLYVWARYRTFNSPHAFARLKGIPYRGVPVMMGYVAAVAVAGAYWMLPAVGFAVVLMYYLLSNVYLSTALGLHVRWLLDFFFKVDHTESPEEIEAGLLAAFKEFAVLTTYAVVVVADDDTLQWHGDVADVVEAGIATPDRLIALSQTVPTENPFWMGTIWVWPVDDVRRTYMVVTGVMRPSDIAEVSKTGGYLVESARLAIETLRRHQQLESAASEEYERARSDPLTGLLNRDGFVEALEDVLRSRTDETVAVLKASLVGFQHTVDVLGAEVGEKLTVGFARRLSRIADDSPEIRSIGRGTDDAFLLAAVGHDLQIEELSETVAVPTGAVEGTSMSRDVWVGVAIAEPGHHIDAEELVQHARLAKDRSEAEGKPMVFGRADATRERRRISVRLRLPQAIESASVRPAFQPQIDLRTRRLVGCEVLARWDDHQIGVVGPNEFVEISEQSQQIELLTLSLLRQTLALDLADASGVRVPLSINLSARSMGNDAFVRSMIGIITDSGRSVEDFTFEVAESTIASDGLATIFGIDHIRSLGARVSIDDFGTGHSTLSYLDKLPVHEIKIDRSMVASMGTSAEPNPIIRHVIGLCDDLGLDVVAEGVETAQQHDLLLDLGCRKAQGYLFARPLDATQAASWIADYGLDTIEV